MKFKLLFLFMFLATIAQAQYFQRTFNFDYVTPSFRDEQLNSGIRTRVNLGGATANYFHVGIGVSRFNAALASPYNRADWVRFIRVNKSGATVNNNRGIEYRDAVSNKQYHATGNSIAEVKDSLGTGGYIAVGAVGDNTITGAVVPGGSDVLYTVLSTSGSVTASYRIDFGNTRDIGWCIRSSAFMPNTWLICGEATFFPSGVAPYTSCFVARIDNLGGILWCSTYNFDPTPGGFFPTANNIAKQLAEDPTTGDIYVVGLLKDFTGANGTDGLSFKLTSAGAFVGCLNYHLSPDDEFQAVRWTSDGNIIVGGFTNFSPGGVPFYDMLLVKISPAGIILFQNLLQVTSGGTAYQSKCYDLIERKNTAGNAEYFLFGPKYSATGIGQVVYKTNAIGVGINSYTYNAQKFDVGYGIDFADNSYAKPGVALFSSVFNGGGVFSDSHMMKTYFNGAACTNYCPADPPFTQGLNVTPPFLQPTTTTSCAITGIKSKNYNFQDKLACNQGMIGCGSNAKTDEDQQKEDEGNLTLYPNPTNNVVNITWYNPSESKNEWQIIDVQGRELISQSEILPEGYLTRQIDLSHIPSGYYIVKITTAESELRKIVIKE